MRVKPFIVAIAFALMLGACTASPSNEPNRGAGGSSPAADVLVLDTDSGPVAVRPATGTVLTQGAGAVAGPDGSRLYTASTSSGTTTLVTRDSATGDQVASASLDGELAVRVASNTGNAVALMKPLPPGVDPWTPVPRSHTTIVVADPTGARTRADTTCAATTSRRRSPSRTHASS